MGKVLEQRVNENMDLERIDLPRKDFSAMSHIDNINYCIQMIIGNGEDIVIGFFKIRSLGVRSVGYRLMQKKKADEIKKKKDYFDYHSLQDFYMKIKDIEAGKYIVRDSIIIGLNRHSSS